MRFVYIGLGTLALFVVALMTGAVDIPATEVLGILMGERYRKYCMAGDCA